MALAPGMRVGPYEIVAPLGRGGMGEVYQGVDTRLNRPVAIKCAQGPFTDRFSGEVRAISALNHPNVCTLYDVGPDYLVMELVDGETLSARLARGRLPLDEVVRLGAQIAAALAAAHAKGITHRDLKPANIMITRTGIKVLDFGLARFSGPAADTVALSHNVAGTPAYMAPEQLEGRAADARTDTFALGLVLREMITGQRLPIGHGQTATLEGVPERLAHVIERCLAFDPDDRWQSVADVGRELEWAARRATQDPTMVAARSRSKTTLALVAGVCTLAGIAAGAMIWRALSSAPPPAATGAEVRSVIPLPPGQRLESSSPLAISPDGTLLAFVAVTEEGTRQLHLRPMASSEAHVIPGTAGAMQPFFSPDGRAIAFFASGALQRVNVDGPAPFRLCAVPGLTQGGAWSSQDIIVISVRGQGLFKVSASGGTLERVTSGSTAAWPTFLSDNTTVLYSSHSAGRMTGYSLVSLDGAAVREVARLSDVDGAGAPVLGAGAEVAQGTVLPEGYLVYGQDPGSVRALPIDPVTLAPRGPSILLGDHVERAQNSGGIAYAVSRTGLLVFAGTGAAHQLVWVTRQGVATPVGADAGAYRQPRLSPDQQTIAVTANDETRRPDLWLVNARRGTRTRLASEAMMPAWTSDGRQLAHFGGGAPLTLATLSSGASEPLMPRDEIRKRLIAGTNAYPTDFSPDGRYLLLQADNQDVWRIVMPDRRLEPVLVGETNDWNAVVSPDGRSVAYVSDASGRAEVYVARWPGLEQKTPVSARGGRVPRWSHDSRELFFWQEQTLMAARLETPLQPSSPQPLFSGAFFGAGRDQAFDVAADGRFLMVKSDERADLRQLTVVQNWMSPRPTPSP